MKRKPPVIATGASVNRMMQGIDSRADETNDLQADLVEISGRVSPHRRASNSVNKS